MNKLIVHIEFDPGNVPEGSIKDRLDDVLGQAMENDLGWRFFDTLGEALAWERGEEGKEVSR